MSGGENSRGFTGETDAEQLARLERQKAETGRTDEATLAHLQGKQQEREANAPPDLQALAEQQTRANRPDTNTPFAGTQWTQGPDGQWRMTTGFTGPLAGLNDSLQQQAASSMANPLDLSGLGDMPNAEAARNQAIEAAYGQAASRLEPQFAKREEALRTRLLNQGLDEGSEAFRNAMGEFGTQRNDAFTSAMNSAIGQGTQAGQALFSQGMASRQQGLAEALRQRGQAMQDLQGLQGFLGQPGFNPDSSTLSGGIARGNQLLAQQQMGQQNLADMLGGAAGLAGGLLPLLIGLSDERAKRNVVRLPQEALPGVPFATWEYLPGYGPPGQRLGVIAQDLARVAPGYVHTRADGMLAVDYSFLFEVSHA